MGLFKMRKKFKENQCSWAGQKGQSGWRSCGINWLYPLGKLGWHIKALWEAHVSEYPFEKHWCFSNFIPSLCRVSLMYKSQLILFLVSPSFTCMRTLKKWNKLQMTRWSSMSSLTNHPDLPAWKIKSSLFQKHSQWTSRGYKSNI